MKRYITEAILILTAFAYAAGADDWHVNSGESIQAAINSASGGDTIYVHAGTYTENVVVNKTLTLRGESRETTIIDGGGTGGVVNIAADDVTFTRFTVQNSGDGDDGVGVLLFSHDNIVLSENIIRYNRDGVEMWGGSNSNTVANNTVESNTCNGIRCSSKNIITNNTVSDNMYGISMRLAAQDNRALNNSISGNEYGIIMTYSGGNNTLRGNTFEDNDCGIEVLESIESDYDHSIDTSNTVNGKPVYYLYGVCDITIGGMDITHLTVAAGTNVTIENNTVRGGDGIYLSFVSDSTVLNNTVSNNHHGISFGYSSDENEIMDNLFSNCMGDGVSINDARDNTFVNNIISNNSGHGIYSTNHKPNRFINNTISNNFGHGVYFHISDDSVFINNTISGNDQGIYLINSVNNTFASNTISNNDRGIRMGSSSGNLVYDNYLANTQNAYDDGANIWNTTNTTGPNIVGGPEIGGNYWSDYAGNDADGDGFGEAAHNIGGGSNRDHLPLVAPATCGDITGDETIDTVDLLLLLEYVVKGTPVDHCIGDIDGNGHINSLDVLLLMGYINNPTGYSLHCGC
jgi:parallel beta-helix repeat protein